MDKKVIEVRLKKLDHAVSRLKRIQRISKDEYTNNQDYQDIAERNFQVAIQTCIDIANYIIAGQNLLVPDEQENVFIVLGKNGVLSEGLILRIKGIVAFRKILMHKDPYTDPDQVYYTPQNQLSDFNGFAKAIISYLAST